MKPLIDYSKDLALVIAGLKILELIKKVIRLWRVQEHANYGVTVKNGAYKSLLATLGRIEARIDRVDQRVENIEERLST